jgi:hypothetical protein
MRGGLVAGMTQKAAFSISMRPTITIFSRIQRVAVGAGTNKAKTGKKGNPDGILYALLFD